MGLIRQLGRTSQPSCTWLPQVILSVGVMATPPVCALLSWGRTGEWRTSVVAVRFSLSRDQINQRLLDLNDQHRHVVVLLGSALVGGHLSEDV